jgi:glucose/arabinose dehydrogenase/azurin
MKLPKLVVRAVLLLPLLAITAFAQSGAKLDFKPGDHVALIGNALPDRMQHTAYLETLLQAKFPKQQLVFRNLAASGDEVVLRARSENFGSPDDWLTRVKADVILAFFGYNESFNGEDGVPKFRGDLDKWIKETKTKDYSGKGAPRIVLFSPIAAEKTRDPNFADPTSINARLSIYTKAMAEVAQDNGILFVDLFNPSQKLFSDAASQGQSLTINGFLLSDAGNKALAPILYQALTGDTAAAASLEGPSPAMEKLRTAIVDKNEMWHSRYRTIDGYNVFGGRSGLAYQPGKGAFLQGQRNPEKPYISNYQVMQEEMAVRDVMTANRDKRVWAVAAGGDLVVDDSNVPEVEKVPTNKPGEQPDGSHAYLDAQEAISKMTVHSGMKVNLFADEKQFPELINPVQMAWDTKGRLWVSAWRNYPERTPWSKQGDSLIVLEDTDGDGKADKVTTFLDDLNAPTGFQFYKDGVLVMQAPDLWFVRDTDGDGKADWKERVLMGMDSADSHHTANAICHDPGGAIYLSDGVFHRTQVETPDGPVRNLDAAIYRYEPNTAKFERFVSYGFANPHGRLFDRWGNGIITDATGNNSYFDAAFSGHIDYPAKHSGMNQFWDRPSRPCPGTGMLSSRHFPDELQGYFMNLNVIGFQGVYMVKVTEDGSGIKGETMENLISSSDPDFRPAAISIGPDGAIYFTDWHNTIIGHMQHHLRDPNRRTDAGRIYRITYDGRPLLKAPKIDGQPIEALLDLLKSPENGTRELAKVELAKHDPAQVVAAVNKWAAALDKADSEYEHHMMEALWVHQWQNVVDVPLLERMLKSPDHRARAAAGRVLCYWRDRVPNALAEFMALANDENPRVRLEAVRAASFYDSPEAVDVALAILKRPTDYYLDYTLGETLRQLQPVWRKALSDGRPIAVGNDVGLSHLLNSVPTTDLAMFPKTPGILATLLLRSDTAPNDRLGALDSLAASKKTSRLTELFAAIQSAPDTTAGPLARLLPTQPPGDLKPLRSKISSLATDGKSADVRQSAWASLAVIDGGFDAVWKMAGDSLTRLGDVLNGIPLITDPELRAKAFDRTLPLLVDVPADIRKAAAGQSQTSGRFVRISLPRKGTLTLAEVQVFSGGKNVAVGGTATQSSTASAGAPALAIDGRTTGEYNRGSSTHTDENSDQPWWEVDLGSEQRIDSIAVWNRTDGTLGSRLDGFTATVLNGSRSPVFQKTGIPAPEVSTSLTVTSDPLGALQQAAIHALTGMGHDPAAVFTALTGLIGKGELVPAATRGIRALPRDSWPKSQAAPAVKGLLAWAKAVPSGNRTSQDYVETVQVAGDLAGLLPADQAATFRKQLKDYRVAVFVIHTVREQMRYDTPRLVVEAGKPFEVIFQNDDFMPHNLVIVNPGTREAVGTAASTMAPDKLDRQGRAFMPRTPNILAGTKLVEAGHQETLKFTAPTATGDYEYVCTFPAHFQSMWGQLIVTDDVDAYLQKNPQATAMPKGDMTHKHNAFE